MRELTAKKRFAIIGAFAALAIAVTAILIAGPFGYHSVCDQCGLSRQTVNWQLPFTECTFFTRSTESETPLSTLLLTNGIVPVHSHHWLFATGAGNGVRCAIGPGRHIRSTIESKEFATLILVLHQRGQAAFRDRILRVAFDPRSSDRVRALYFRGDGAEMSDTDLERWVSQYTEYLDDVAPDSKRK